MKIVFTIKGITIIKAKFFIRRKLKIFMKKSKLLILSLILISTISPAQDIHFSQFYLSTALLDPSDIGNYNGDHRGVVQYRDQWRSATIPYQTYAMAYDMRFKTKKVRNDFWGLGITAFNDQAGDLKMGTSQANVGLGYHKELIPDHFFSFGFQGGFRQYTINFDNAQWGSQYNGTKHDPALPNGNNFYSSTFSVADFNGGVQWNYASEDRIKANAGLAVHHLNSPPSFFFDHVTKRNFRKVVAHASTEIEVTNTNTTYIPKVLVVLQGPSIEIIAGSLVRYQLGESSKYTGLKKESAIYLGGFYRYQDALVIAMHYEYENFGLGFSYDVNILNLASANNGRNGFEVTLKIISPFFKT